MTTGPNSFPNDELELAKLKFFQALEGQLGTLYARLAENQPGLVDFAQQMAEAGAAALIEGMAEDEPQLGDQRHLLEKGMFGFIAMTAQPEGDAFTMPSVPTFGETFYNIVDAVNGNVVEAAREWALMPGLAWTITKQDDSTEVDHLYTNPDARMATLFMTVAMRGFSSGMLDPTN